MEHWLENILHDLNSISRIAVLEQSLQTEKMICNYSKLLKYRWNYENKVVTASMEIDMIRMLFEFYQIKWNTSFTYDMNTTFDTKSIFIPHYTIVAYTTLVLELLEKTSHGYLEVLLEVDKADDTIIIKIQILGNETFDKIIECLQNDSSISYESIVSSRKRWNNAFGDSTIELSVKNNKYFNLSFTASDNYNGN
jgi:hypothetical protein